MSHYCSSLFHVPFTSEATGMKTVSGKHIFKQFVPWPFYMYKVMSFFGGTFKNWPVCQVQLRLQRVASSWAVQTWQAAEASRACLSQQEAGKQSGSEHERNLLWQRPDLYVFNTFLKIFLSFFFFFKHLYWSIIALQCSVSFCCITTWISYTYTYIPTSPEESRSVRKHNL